MDATLRVVKVTHYTQLKFGSPAASQAPPPMLISFDEFNWHVLSLLKVKEVDLDTAIKCLSQNYKIFKDSGRGLEPVTLSIADMAEMMNHRKAGKLFK